VHTADILDGYPEPGGGVVQIHAEDPTGPGIHGLFLSSGGHDDIRTCHDERDNLAIAGQGRHLLIEWTAQL
jgi:hypothetical protein